MGSIGAVFDGNLRRPMTNVLAYSEAWGQGGIEAFVMNVVRAVQGQDLSFDICSTWDWSDSYDKELEEARVHRFSLFKGEKPGQVTRLVKGVSFFTDRLKARHYDAVWINTMNGMGFSYAKAAERLGVPVRVVHAHSADVGVGASGVKRLVSSLGSSLYGGVFHQKPRMLAGCREILVWRTTV